MSLKKDSNLALFEGRQIRKTLHEGEWWFAVVDIVQILTGSSIPKRYWSDLKRKLIAEGYSEVSEKIGQLKLTAPDGKQRFTDCANTETLFRIIQSIPSPKVEPLRKDAKDGGAVAGRTRKYIERQTGKPVISAGNFKQLRLGGRRSLNRRPLAWS
jgi:hypothetical protein